MTSSETEERNPLLDSLFDADDGARCLVAPDGSVLRVNREWLRASGLSLDDALSANIADALPGTREAVHALHAGSPAVPAVEVPRHRRLVAGRETWWAGRIEPVPTSGGTGFLVTLRDVGAPGLPSEGGPGENDEFADLLDATFASMTQGVMVYGPAGEMLRMNAAAERILGVPFVDWAAADGIRGRSALVRLRTARDEPMAPEETPVWRALHGEQVLDAQMTIRRPSGEEVWVSANAAPIRDGSGVRGAVVTFSDVTEQWRSRRELDAARARFDAMFEAANDAILVGDPDSGRVLSANPAACAMFGYTQQELMELSRPALVDVESPGLRAVIEERAAKGHSRGEVTYRRKGGGTFTGELTTALFSDARGQRRAIGIIRDVTHVRRAEAETRSIAQFPLENPNPVLRASQDGDVLFANAPAKRFLGGLGWSEGHALPEVLLREIRLVSREQPVRAHEITGAGQVWSLTLSASSGEGHVNVFGVEITERKRAEEALRENEARLRSLADSIPQLAWTAQPDGYIDWYNRRWYEYTGTTPDEMKGWGWQSVHDPATLPEVMRRWKESIATGSAFDMQFPLRGADGRFRSFLTRVYPLKDRRGSVLQWFGTNTDVTELVEAQEALRESDRRKDEFLAVLSHELRNPLAPIRNSIEVLERTAPGSDQAARAREILRRQTDHMTRLVGDLLDLTRISRGKIAVHPVLVDLREVVRNVADDARALFDRARVSLQVEHPAGAIWVNGDSARLAQVFGNLLHNASKFTPAGGAVHVSVAADGERARVAVHDTGIGMAPDDIGRIFEPFAQVAQGLARTAGGLGLGLSLARTIAELHGGTIGVRSEGPGRGSEFVVSLPLAVRRGAEVETQGHEGIAAREVLVIDDNVDGAMMLAALLETMGHRVRVAHDAGSGIAAALASAPDVVLCDIGLPDWNGYDVARALRAEPALKGTMLVALSGYALPEDQERALEAGFDAHLAKPAPLDQLEVVLREASAGQARGVSGRGGSSPGANPDAEPR